jgi:hypothetical protein
MGLLHLLEGVAEQIELVGNRPDRGQILVGIPILSDALSSNLVRAQTRVEPGRLELRIDLTLSIDDRSEVDQPVRLELLGSLPAPHGERIDPGETALELSGLFADRLSVPA